VEIKRAFLLTVFVWVLSASLSLAQTIDPEAVDSEPDTAVAEATEPEPAPEPIPVGVPLPNIGTAAEDLRKRAGDVSAWLALGDEAASRLAEMSLFLALVANSADEMEKLDVDSLDRSHINEMRNLWRGYAEQISNYQQRFSEYATELEDFVNEFEQLSALWLETRVHAEYVQALQIVVLDIQGGLDLIEPVLSQLITRRVPVLTYQSLLTQHSLLVSDVRDQIELADSEFRRNLFKINAPPIWSIAAMEPGFTSRVNPFTLIADTSRRFVEAQIVILSLHLTLLALAIAVAFWWRRQLGLMALQEDRALEKLRSWLARPVAVGILTGMLAGSFLYVTKPVLFAGLAAVVMLLATARLLSVQATGRQQWRLLALILLGLSELVLSQIVTPTVGSRFLLLAENLIALWLCWVFLTRPPEDARAGPVRELAWRLAHLAPLLLLAALLANGVGALPLATLLVRGTTSTIVAALVLYVGMVLATGLVTHFLRHRQQSMARLLQDHARALESSLHFLIRLTALWLWIKSGLASFGIIEQVRTAMISFLTSPLTMGTFSVSASQVLGFVLVIVAAILLSKLIRLLLEEQLLARIRLPRGVAGALSIISRYIILSVGFLAALSVAGVDLSQIGIIIGALGVGIGLGLQNIVGNFVSGLILVFERPIQAGDVIQVGTLLGRVQQIGVRASQVRTFDGSEVILPNSDLVTRELTNWTMSDNRRRIDIPVITDLKVRPREIVELLESVAAGKDNVLADPGPVGLFEGAEEGFFKFILRFWVPFEHGVDTKNEIAMQAYEALEAAGVKLPDLSIRRRL
jgi:potassium efflux system protein